MAIKQSNPNQPADNGGDSEGIGVNVGAQAGTRRPEGRNEGHLGRRAQPLDGVGEHGQGNPDGLSDAAAGANRMPDADTSGGEDSDATR